VITDIRSVRPEYKIAIFHIMTPWDLVCRRAASRADSTGRVVPEADLRDSFEKVPKSVEKLAPLVDFVAYICNDEQPSPTLVKTVENQMVFEHPSWFEVRRRFADMHCIRIMDQQPTHRAYLLNLIKSLTENKGAVLFVKTYCSNSKMVKKLFSRRGLAYDAVYLDTLKCEEGTPVVLDSGASAFGVAFQVVLNQYTGEPTTPQLFIKGKYIGGFSTVVDGIEDGTIQQKINAA